MHSSESDRYETLVDNTTTIHKESAFKSRSPNPLPTLGVCASTMSLGKRKVHPEDEIAGNSSDQQSPASKRTRTLLDDSLSLDSFTHPSTPSKQSNDHQVEASPGSSSPLYGFPTTPTPQTKVAVTIPKTVSKLTPAFTTPLSTVCGHSIHPAYGDFYAKTICPMCLAEASMNGLQGMQDRINDVGGLVEWQKMQNKYHCKTYEWMPTSGKEKKKKRTAYTDAIGTDVSYRHRKRQLVHLITELEALSEMEAAWEAKQLPENSNVYIEHVRLRKQYSATAALHCYYDTVDNGFLGRIEDDCNYMSRRLGRCWKIASEPGFPDSENIRDTRMEEKKRKALERHTKSFKWETFTKDQRRYIESSKIPKVYETPKTRKTRKTRKSDNTNLLPTRKRRREDAGVSFNEDVYVRTDADVDVLREAAPWLSEDLLGEPASKKPRMGILRTTRLKRSEVSNIITPLDRDPKPTRPHHVIPLNRKDGPVRDVTKSRMGRRRSSYHRGQWAVPEGSELIDTSGYRREFKHHEAIVEGLRKEAVRMDDKDLVEKPGRRSEDTEMKDTPVAEREAMPQSSLSLLPS